MGETIGDVNVRELLITNKKCRPYCYANPKGLVIHWTANMGIGADAEANRNYFQNLTSRAASAHYCVDSTEAVRCIPENEVAYHAGAASYKESALKSLNTTYPNNCTIGIEMCVNADGNFWKMYHNTVYLAAYICKKYGFKTDNLYRHYDITGKTCPAFFVSNYYAYKYLKTSPDSGWNKFKADVERIKAKF